MWTSLPFSLGSFNTPLHVLRIPFPCTFLWPAGTSSAAPVPRRAFRVPSSSSTSLSVFSSSNYQPIRVLSLSSSSSLLSPTRRKAHLVPHNLSHNFLFLFPFVFATPRNIITVIQPCREHCPRDGTLFCLSMSRHHVRSHERAFNNS